MDNNAHLHDLTLVVGGGPAGASCAWKLALYNIPCLLIDKAEFPRDKVCGGALSAGAAALLTSSGMVTDVELEMYTLREHRTLSFWDRNELLRTYTSPDNPIRLISRKEFDDWLLEKASSAGAAIITGDAVTSVNPSSITTSSGREYSFSNLVGADGCGSIVRKFSNGKLNRGTGLGLEYFIPLSDFRTECEGLQIHFGYIPYGYIWVFPGVDRIAIGAGAIGSPASPSEILGALNEFLTGKGISPEDHQLHGASIPSLSLDRNLGKDNIYLAGDAAGLVDQVSGEGIRHAVQSGLLAAECIASGGGRWRILKSNNSCISSVSQSVFYRHLLFSRITRRTAMTGLRDNIDYAEGYWNIISGMESYNEMFSRILT